MRRTARSARVSRLSVSYDYAKTKTNLTNPYFIFKRRLVRSSSIYFQALMIKSKVIVLPYSVTINQSPLVSMIMFNLMTEKKIIEQSYHQKQC